MKWISRVVRVVVLFGAGVCGCRGEVISWTKPASGLWQDASAWSLPRLPGEDLEGVLITNAGWKAVEINAATTLDYPNSVSIQALYVEAPQDGYNLLLLNYVGADRPLEVASDVVFGPATSLLSLYSGVKAGSMYFSGSAEFSSSTVAVATNLVVGPSAQGELNLTNSLASGRKLILALGNSSTANHVGGVTDFTNIIILQGGSFNLNAGWVSAETLDVQSLGDFELEYGWQKRTGAAQVRQTGGSMQARVMRLGMSEMAISGATGEYWLEGGMLICPELQPINGLFRQTGGTNLSTSVTLPKIAGAQADYHISGGVLVSSNITLGAGSPFGLPGVGIFLQSGGIHTNHLIQPLGEVRKQQLHVYGEYRLTGGLLYSDRINPYSGSFMQNGGTNWTREVSLDCGGSYDLAGGLLVTSNTVLRTCFSQFSVFTNRAGVHHATNLLSLGTCVRYVLDGGTLSTPFITIAEGAELSLASGVVVNPGAVVLQGGAIRAGGVHELGNLQIATGGLAWCGGLDITNSVLWFGGFGAPGILRFLDSRNIQWTGELVIREYNPTNAAGSDRLFIGTDQNGLNSDQLARITFLNPYGWPMGTYPARITSQGEILPTQPEQIAFSSGNGQMILSWNEPHQLATATNLAEPFEIIPGATSPFTNSTSSSPQRYFRLQ
jgi:hypothetical protein